MKNGTFSMKEWDKKGYTYVREGFTISPHGQKFILTWTDSEGNPQQKESEGWKGSDFKALKEYAEELMSKKKTVTLHKTYLELTEEEKRLHNAELKKWNIQKGGEYYELL